MSGANTIKNSSYTHIFFCFFALKLRKNAIQAIQVGGS
jgi:hypothetical protein